MLLDPLFSPLTCLLYEAALGSPHEPLLYPVTKPFQRFRYALFLAPALHLQDPSSLFSLFITEEEAYTLGVLDYQLRPSFKPVVYLLKKKTNYILQLRDGHPAYVPWQLLSSLFVNQKLTFGLPTTILPPQPILSLNL